MAKLAQIKIAAWKLAGWTTEIVATPAGCITLDLAVADRLNLTLTDA